MKAYTNERSCVADAECVFRKTGQPPLIFKQGRKYIYVTGERRQQGESFKNAFGEIMYFSVQSDIYNEYESNGYKLRGWVNTHGSFKNN